MVMVIDKEKKELRREILAQLLSLTKDEIKRRSSDVEKNLSKLPIYRDSEVIMVYYPLRGEVDILEMIRKDLKNKRFCFPVMDLEAKDLTIFEVKDLEHDFIPGPYSVKEPDPKQTKEVDAREIDVLIVPGLAYDRQRNRLGRGAGFYDRFIKKLKPSTKKIGLAFELQILDNLPIHLIHDQKVDVVISENIIV